MKTKSEIWFERLKDLWIRKATEEIGSLMSSEFSYYENPFEKPIVNLTQLELVWEEVKEQGIVKLEIFPLVCGNESGTAYYHFVATIGGVKHESRGSYFVKLDNDGKATEFRQWWNSK